MKEETPECRDGMSSISEELKDAWRGKCDYFKRVTGPRDKAKRGGDLTEAELDYETILLSQFISACLD